MSKVMIDNKSIYSMNYVMNYLAGYTVNLLGKIKVVTVDGVYYNNIIVTDIE